MLIGDSVKKEIYYDIRGGIFKDTHTVFQWWIIRRIIYWAVSKVVDEHSLLVISRAIRGN